MVRPDDFRPSAGFAAAAAKLKPGDICIDCGANVGSYTQFLAKHGAEVFAFEPDPVAFACLERRFGASPGIHLSAAAVGTADGKEKLFMHEHYKDDPVHYSQGSSLVREKINVGTAYREVEVIDLASFIKALSRPVAILKMDIEGAEVDVINHLLDSGLEGRIQAAFVEMHDHKIPSLRSRSDALRERLSGRSAWDLDWH